MFKTMFFIGWTVLCGSLGHVCLSKGMRGMETFGFFTVFGNPWVAAGILLEIFYFLLWIVVLSMAEVSFAVPMSAMEYFIVTFLAISFLKESVGVNRWIGLMLICVGVYFMMCSWEKEGGTLARVPPSELKKI